MVGSVAKMRGCSTGDMPCMCGMRQPPAAAQRQTCKVCCGYAHRTSHEPFRVSQPQGLCSVGEVQRDGAVVVVEDLDRVANHCEKQNNDN